MMGGIGSGRKPRDPDGRTQKQIALDHRTPKPHGLDPRSPKRCSICHDEFERSLDNFNWHDYAWDNLQSYCRQCQSAYSRRWWYENRTLARIRR